MGARRKVPAAGSRSRGTKPPGAEGAEASYRLAQLAAAAGVTPRAVRFYIKRGLLKAPTFRGQSTRYGEDHLHRLRAIVRLRAEKRLRLDAIKKRLAKLSPGEIAALAAQAKVSPAADPPAAEVPPAPAALPGATRWDRMDLLPGLELSVRSDATALVRRLAAEILERYRTLAAER